MNFLPVSFVSYAQEFMSHAAPAMPTILYWLPPLIFITLAIAAIVDAFSSRVPDPLIFFGGIVITAALGFSVSWPAAALNLAYAIWTGMAVWALNEIWYRVKGEDAIGMGDAKWTMLASMCFGWQPLLVAWGAGAILGVMWIEFMRMIGRPIQRVHFAPFLLIGLAVGIWWLRFRG